MLTSGNLPPLLHNHHGRRHSTAVFGASIPMVRNSPKDHQRPRPLFHISLRVRANQRSGDRSKPINGIPPSNGRPIRTSKPVGRTVLTPHHRKSNRMEQVATNGNRGPQQQQKLHHRLRPKRITNRMGTPPISRTTFRIKESNCGRIPV